MTHADRDDDAIHDAAALWFARESGGTLSPALQQELSAWRQADPAHDAAYQAMRATWQASAAMPAADLRSIVQGARPVASGRRRLVWGGVALTASAAGIAVLARPALLAQPGYVARHATGTGQRQSLALPDGSTLELNTRTALEVRFYAQRREVLLEHGEAWFSVQPDTTRPFYVQADPAEVRVVGTRFSVRREGEHVQVGVSSGAVQVRTGRLWNRQSHALRVGDGLQTHQDGAVQLRAVDARNVAAWRQGKAVFDGTPLGEVVAELNRYRDLPIEVRDPALAQARIAGVFSVDDTDAFLETLPRLMPVQVLHVAGLGPRIVRL